MADMRIDDAIAKAENIINQIIRSGAARCVYVDKSLNIRSLNVNGSSKSGFGDDRVIGVYDHRITSLRLAEDIKYWRDHIANQAG